MKNVELVDKLTEDVIDVRVERETGIIRGMEGTSVE